LSDSELLAIFLRTGMRGRSAVDLARDLHNHFGSLSAILTARPADLMQRPGMGQAKYAQLHAALELARRHLLACADRGGEINGPAAVREFIQLRLKGMEREIFYCLFLDNRHRILRHEPLFLGTINSATVHIREIVKSALACNAAAVILAHNHPSGVAEPSEADIRVTRRIADALSLVEIRLLDHFVVGEGAVESLAERGLL